jgi:hypothetical protein
MYSYCNISQWYARIVAVWLFQSVCKVVTRLNGRLGMLHNLKLCDVNQYEWSGMLHSGIKEIGSTLYLYGP